MGGLGKLAIELSGISEVTGFAAPLLSLGGCHNLKRILVGRIVLLHFIYLFKHFYSPLSRVLLQNWCVVGRGILFN